PNKVTIFQNEPSVSIPELNHTTVVNHPFVSNFELNTEQAGETEVVYKVGKFPVKKVDVTVLENHEVVPAGQSIGVQLHTLDVLVVVHQLVNHIDQSNSPAENSDIKVGDIIVEIDRQNIKQL